MSEKEPILIIDTDILNFTVCRITEDITEFDDQLCESFDEESTIRLFKEGLKKIGKDTGYAVKDIYCALSSPTNFRKNHFPTYKSNRKKVVKPLGLKFLRQYQLDNADEFNTIMIEDLEGDDVMSYFATSDSSISIYSLDKDMLTVPVRQWSFRENKFHTPTPLEALRYLYSQVLTGDTTDGYVGCKGIGKIKAEAALKDCKNELEMLEASYVRFNKVFPEAIEAKSKLLEQIGQAKILHAADYITLINFNKTYDPFKVLNVCDDMLIDWSKEYAQQLLDIKEAKKAAKRKPKVKDAI